MIAYDQFAAFVANLGKYNEGDIVGDWLPLPYDPDELGGWLRQHALIGTADEFGQPYEEYLVMDFGTYGGCLVREDADDPMCFDVLLLATPFDSGTDGRYVGCVARVDLSDLPDSLASEVGGGLGAGDAEGRLAGVDRGSLAAELVQCGDNPCILQYETFHDGIVYEGALGPEPMSATDVRGLMEWAGVDPGLLPADPALDHETR